jgi:predicted nucleotidyltransferase
VEKLRLWPELSQTVERIDARRDVFAGVLLLGSLSRGEGDAISDVDLVAVTHLGRWQEAWEDRLRLSSGALITFDRSEGKQDVAGHSWLAPNLVKVECLITAPRRMRLRGNVVVVLGEDDLPESFERAAPFTRREVDDYAARLRETDAISDIERAYGDLIALLRREIREPSDADQPIE